MNRFKWATILVLVTMILVTAACSSVIQPVNVNSVTAEEVEGDYVAIVQGEFPDSCGRIGPTFQRVEGDALKVSMALAPTPPGMMCAAMITPFTEEVPLDTSELAPGSYELVVNGVTAPLEIGADPMADAAPLLAPVHSVEVAQDGDGVTLVISGDLPDACHELGEVTQQVDGNAINVSVEMTPPEPGMVCAQMITPYTVEAPIEDSLDPGVYTVTVNDYVTDVTIK